MAASSHSRQRRAPRVAYSAPVRLSGEWSDREPWFVPLLAQSLDLSEGGMALVTPLHLRLGAAVTCSMRLGGRQTYLVGRVVWDRTAHDGTKRAGIQFVSPSDEDTGLMRRLLAVGQTHPHRVNVRFEGRPDTMTALARVTRSGLTLSAPLPILRRNTAVRFAFEGLGPTFEGRVDRVRLAHLQGMPALRVGIRVDRARDRASAPQPATVRPAVEPGPVREDATPTAVEVAVAVPSSEPPSAGWQARIGALAARMKRDPMAARPWLLLVLCALASGALVHELWPRAGHESVASHVRTVSAAPEPIAALPSPAALRSAETAVPDVPTAAPPAAIAATPRDFQPTFKWRRDRRELLIPLAGDLTTLRDFRIHSPTGIAIDVPAARGADHVARYAVRHPGVSRVDVTPWARGSRIRIWVQQPFDDYRLERSANGIRVVLPVAR